MSGFDPDFRKILFLKNNEPAPFVLEPFYDLVRRHFLLVRVRDFFVADRAEVRGSQLTETELLFPGRRINRYRNVDEAKADTAFPNRTHSRWRLFTTPG